MPEGTLIAHLDVDAFYVAVEVLRRPELAGKPVVVAGSGPRAVVTTASYEARRYGVGSAMPAARARRLCPHAVFIEPDFAAYRAISRQLMGIVAQEVQAIEVVGLDEAYLDLSPLAFPHAAMRTLLARIEAATGLTCSVGIGPNKLVAKVASDAEKPQGFVVLSRQQACERFAGAPPALLPGIGPKTAARLDALGLRTIRALAHAPQELLVRRFGPTHGRDLHRRARFENDAPVSQARSVLSASRERTFDHDIADHALLARALERMSAELCASLHAKQQRGRTVAIKVRLEDFTTITRARTLATPTRDPRVVAQTACTLLAENRPQRPVRLLGVRLAGLASDQDAPGRTSGEAAPRACQRADAPAQLPLPL
jgi:DNA polymerase-4